MAGQQTRSQSTKSEACSSQGTTSKVQRHLKNEICCKGGRGSQRPMSYFFQCLGDVDFYFRQQTLCTLNFLCDVNFQSCQLR